MNAGQSLADEVEAWLAVHWHEGLTVREWWSRLVDAGYAYPTWPAGVGGSGRTQADARAITSVLAAHHVVGPPTGGLAAYLAAPTILEHGTPEQIKELVRPIALGEAAWCQLFSEPGSGSDLASVGTRAVRDRDEWVVHGQKVWNSGADKADMGMLLARTDVDRPKHRGITYFAIDMHQPGVEVRPLRVMSGRSPFCEVFLSGARVRPEHRIGPLHEGWRVAQTTLASERAMVAGGGIRGFHAAQAGSAGDLDRSIGEVIARASNANRERSPLRSGAVPVALMLDLARSHERVDDPVIRQQLARYWSQVKVNSWTMRRSAAVGGRLTGADGSIAKLSTARICQDSADLSYRIAGAQLLLAGGDSPFGVISKRSTSGHRATGSAAAPTRSS